MQFEIIRAVPEDIEELTYIMETVTEGMEKKEWFISDDRDYIEKRISSIPIAKEDLGFILKAVTQVEGKTRIAGFFMADFPGATERNLGTYLDMGKAVMSRVAHMDSVVILPEFRGHKLQYRFLEAAEEVLLKETEYRTLLTTVHPQNQYSLKNVLSMGYEVAAEVMKYGIYRRYILKKEIG